jgi:hypothetical protein
LVVANVIRIAGAVTVLVMGIFLWVMFHREDYGRIPPRALRTATLDAMNARVRERKI